MRHYFAMPAIMPRLTPCHAAAAMMRHFRHYCHFRRYADATLRWRDLSSPNISSVVIEVFYADIFRLLLFHAIFAIIAMLRHIRVRHYYFFCIFSFSD
jgi:hypothetical protein